MAEPEHNIVHIGEWPGISDLFLIHIGFDGWEMLSKIYDSHKGKITYRQILETFLREALIEFSKK